MVVRRRGSQFFQTNGSQMAVSLSDVLAGRPLPPTKFLVFSGVKMFGHPSGYNLSLRHLTWCPCYQWYCLLFAACISLLSSWDSTKLCALSAPITWFWDWMLCWFEPFLSADVVRMVVSFLLLHSKVGPCSLMFWLISRFLGTGSGGLIQCCVLPLWACPANENVDVDRLLRALFQWFVPYTLFHIRTEYYELLRSFSPKSSLTGLSMWDLYLAGTWSVFILHFPGNLLIL
jgi:hypothetical protein